MLSVVSSTHMAVVPTDTAEKGVTEQRVVQYRTTDMSFQVLAMAVCSWPANVTVFARAQSSVVYSVPVTDNTKISSASAYISSDNTVAYTYFAGSKYVEGVSLSGRIILSCSFFWRALTAVTMQRMCTRAVLQRFQHGVFCLPAGILLRLHRYFPCAFDWHDLCH